MFAAYCNLLEQLATKNSAWVENSRELLPEAQLRERLAVNNTAASVSQETLHSLFINQVKVRSLSAAVITPKSTFTYQELYQKANQLAHRLRQLGATTNTLVAVVMDKGWEQIVAVLGILISGAAYLSIDPALPQERQWYLLSQGEVKLVVTQPHLNCNLSWPSGIQRLEVNNKQLGEVDSSVYGGNRLIFEQSAFSVFLIGKMSAIAPMYGELAKDFCLLEAGHIGQLLMNTAPTQQIGLCPIGYLEFTELQDLFHLESSQVLFYSFVAGKIDLLQTKHRNSLPISTQLSDYLRQKLPTYMIPCEYIFLDALPLTPNGKVDRKALPVPKIGASKSVAVLTPPTTEIEHSLAKIVQELLQIEALDIDNNFFELGMDSLKLVQMKNKLLSALQVNISMQQLLVEANNIAKLALAVDEQLTLVKIKQKPLSNQLNNDTEIFQI
ncbi:AMP-binding protein [Nostoc sp. CHAB 5784]|uniref:AMP-binding protein n=1 Tax=Nostoc mirabile TaxID=2907820 RepID=UPI001E60081A|nr:AMP-binding protein [Nostoc mirabile]MCC5666166.1 AMP-binding protein [Nostoc mirabile CHAB5784]